MTILLESEIYHYCPSAHTADGNLYVFIPMLLPPSGGCTVVRYGRPSLPGCSLTVTLNKEIRKSSVANQLKKILLDYLNNQRVIRPKVLHRLIYFSTTPDDETFTYLDIRSISYDTNPETKSAVGAFRLAVAAL
jgi:hypothetical protein